MAYYRRRLRCCPLDALHLLGKKLTWEENFAYANSTSPWVAREGTIHDISWDRKAYWVSNDHDTLWHWVDPAWGQYRAVALKAEERKDEIHASITGI
jgi:hypothetical protein